MGWFDDSLTLSKDGSEAVIGVVVPEQRYVNLRRGECGGRSDGIKACDGAAYEVPVVTTLKTNLMRRKGIENAKSVRCGLYVLVEEGKLHVPDDGRDVLGSCDKRPRKHLPTYKARANLPT